MTVAGVAVALEPYSWGAVALQVTAPLLLTLANAEPAAHVPFTRSCIWLMFERTEPTAPGWMSL